MWRRCRRLRRGLCQLHERGRTSLRWRGLWWRRLRHHRLWRRGRHWGGKRAGSPPPRLRIRWLRIWRRRWHRRRRRWHRRRRPLDCRLLWRHGLMQYGGFKLAGRELPARDWASAGRMGSGRGMCEESGDLFRRGYRYVKRSVIGGV